MFRVTNFREKSILGYIDINYTRNFSKLNKLSKYHHLKFKLAFLDRFLAANSKIGRSLTGRQKLKERWINGSYLSVV